MIVASFIACQRADQVSPRAELSCPGGVESLVLQMEGPSPTPPPGAPSQPRRCGQASTFEASSAPMARRGSRRPRRRRLGGLEEDRRALHGRPGARGRPRSAAATLTRPDKAADPLAGPGEARLHAAHDQRQVVRGPHRDPDRRGQALPGLVSTWRPGVSRGSPSASTTTPSRDRRDPDGRSDEGRGRRRRHVPLRQGFRVHRGPLARRCQRLGSPGRWAESGRVSITPPPRLHSTLEFELLQRHRFATKADARREVAASSTATTRERSTAPVR